MTQLASNLFQSTQECLLLAAQIGSYAKFTPKQKSITLAIMHVPRAIGLSSIGMGMAKM